MRIAKVLLLALPLLAFGCSGKGKVKVGGDGVDAKYESGRQPGEGAWDDADPEPDVQGDALPEGGGRSIEGHASDERALVTLPGFRMLRGGASRVFVEVSSNVPVKEKKDAGTVRVRLEGVTVPERVNMMSLPTMHFPTPVGRVRLAQVDDDAELIIELRQPSKSKVRVKQAEGGTVVSIDFPRLGAQIDGETAVGTSRQSSEQSSAEPRKDY